MTREEASQRIQDLRRKVQKPKYRALGWVETWIYKEDIKALDMAVKDLEQEPVLDRVRAEIDKIYEREGNSFDCLNALDELKEFIDKCKAESEE